jgi:hypothetical protein
MELLRELLSMISKYTYKPGFKKTLKLRKIKRSKNKKDKKIQK